jgi:hypothetical protein
MLRISFLDPDAIDLVGDLPAWLNENNPKPAREQLNDAYRHGGGWHPIKGFIMYGDYSIRYPGDPVLHPVATAQLRDELILFYPHSWVCIMQPDKSFEIARMD